MTNQTTKAITFALFAMIAAVAWLGIAATTITLAHAAACSAHINSQTGTSTFSCSSLNSFNQANVINHHEHYYGYK